LHIIDLDLPYSPPRYLPHRTSWEVADVQWSPFAARDFWVISTSNQKALVWNLGIKSWQDSVEFVLHGHTRAITDINFSAHHPDVLATCAVDSFVHCWDLRVPARPVISFSDWFAGATQVKWSRQVSHVIASSHDKYLRIWDDRMGAYPVRSIEAHGTKIYGIDWNRYEQNRIVTCSLDKSIKFWDCNNLEDTPERIINTPFPAWRARHTPFGWGLLAMPQRGNSDLHLYDRRIANGQYVSGAVPPVAHFEGHKGQVKEFLWRPRGTVIDGTDHREFQLVTWGTDQQLRLHRIIPETLSAIGYEKGLTQIPRLNFTRRDAKYKTFRDEPLEENSTEVFDSQAGSSPAVGQSFHPRPRGSTSVGMSKVTIPHPQGWLQGNNATARIGMHGRANARQIINPIDWMKNVKSTSWNPETLGEEISQVGEKFAKVAFESVDMSQRKAVISMHAPWGDSGAPIFMKIDLKFPIAYPREAAAIFNVQKTAAMTEGLAGLLSTELRTIAETYVARKRGCLEALLRYLLREQDMEQIMSWILGESLDESKMVDGIGFEEDISSDEDDVGMASFQGPSGINNSTQQLNSNVLVPVPKVCGAVWADDGKLVCFFPSKPKQPMSFLGTLGIRNSDSDEGGKVFEGFGRLNIEPPGAKTTLRTITSAEDQASELSDDSSPSSSSSSGSSDSLVSLPTHFFPRDAWRPGRGALQRSRSADHSTQSAIGLSQTQFETESSENMVSIHDFSEHIPSKRQLAAEYMIFGTGPDVCGHNAEVARKYGQDDTAHIWRLMKLILWNEVPLESVKDLHGSSDILTISRSASDLPKRNDSGVDMSYDGKVNGSKTDVPGRIRWGESALGGSYLVPAMIHYFESVGDVQMLAMLSCVFAESRTSDPSTVSSQHHNQRLLMQLKAPAFSVDYHPSFEVAQSTLDKRLTSSLASTSPATKMSDSYHGTLIDKTGYSNPTTPYSTGSTPPNQHPSHQPSNRRRSSRLSSTEIRDHKPRQSISTIRSRPVSLSTSPEDTRSAQRSSSNIAFSLSRASLAGLTPSYSHSPPNASSGSGGNKRPSPVGSFMGHHVNPGGWTAASIFGSGIGRGKPEVPALVPRQSRSSANLVRSTSMVGQSQSMSSDGDAAERALRPASHLRTPIKSRRRSSTNRKIKIKSALHNQNMFDEDGYASLPLLNPILSWKYRAYRSSYARLLGVWGLHTQRAEVLKFDGLLGNFTPATKGVAADRSMNTDERALENILRRKTLDSTRNNIMQSRGLEVRRQCNQCGKMLQAIEKNGMPIGWHCGNCALSQTRCSTRTLCTICTKSITGLMVPCLNCGHVTCFGCHKKWLARDNDIHGLDESISDASEAVEKPCPTGCDCICSSHQFITAPYPPTLEDEDEQEQIQEDLLTRSPTRTLTASEAADLISTHGPDTAIGAFLSLSRARSVSSSKAASDKGKGRSKAYHAENAASQLREETAPAETSYTDAWAKYANMGKGLGAGLTRAKTTLRERGSDATIRGSEAEARLRRAGTMYE
jgi:WD repeat-containing protein 59